MDIKEKYEIITVAWQLFKKFDGQEITDEKIDEIQNLVKPFANKYQHNKNALELLHQAMLITIGDDGK